MDITLTLVIQKNSIFCNRNDDYGHHALLCLFKDFTELLKTFIFWHDVIPDLEWV